MKSFHNHLQSLNVQEITLLNFWCSPWFGLACRWLRPFHKITPTKKPQFATIEFNTSFRASIYAHVKTDFENLGGIYQTYTCRLFTDMCWCVTKLGANTSHHQRRTSIGTLVKVIFLMLAAYLHKQKLIRKSQALGLGS